MDALVQDLRFTLRNLRRTPGFLIAAVLTIALGIGATTAVFTAVDRIVLRPLPFPDSERTVVLCEMSQRTADFCVASPPNVVDWAQMVPALESAGVARSESALVEEGGRSIGVPGGIASAGFFRVIAARAAYGRLLQDADLNPSRNNVVVVSDAFWREHLGARPDPAGQSITLDGRPFQIVGVLAPNMYLPSALEGAQVWKPLTAGIDNPDQRSWRGFLALGRLTPGVTLDQFKAQLEVARARLAQTYPDTNATWGVRTLSLREHTVGSLAPRLWLFLGAVALVLLVACANVASLLLVRAASRGPEFAVRVSLGAGRLRLIRQLLTESLVIASAGGALGLWLSALLTKTLVRLAPPGIPRLDEVQLDVPTAFVAIGVTAVTAVVFGLAPARASVIDAPRVEDLKSGRQTAGRESRAHSALLVVELTFSVMLLLLAGALTRSFASLAAWTPGFDPSGVTVSFLTVPSAPGVTTTSAVARLEEARAAVAAMPGVVGAGLTSGGSPLFGGVETGTVTIDDRPPLPADELPATNWFDVDSNYFATLNRSIRNGRGFGAGDVEGAPPVAIVNESFVARVLSGGEAIGRRVTVQQHPADIVGVIADVPPLEAGRPTPAEIFWPIRQYPRLGAYLVMRTDPHVATLERAAKARLVEIDPTLRTGTFSTLNAKFATTLVSPRFNMLLIATFALVASILGVIGVYGVIAYTVSRRTREIGLRIALGATPRGLVSGIVKRVVILTAIGIATGVGLTLVTERLISSLIAGVTLTDPIVLVTTIAGFLAVTTGAGYIPARRASRVDPLTALNRVS